MYSIILYLNILDINLDAVNGGRRIIFYVPENVVPVLSMADYLGLGPNNPILYNL
jgi:hypothetical protein